MYEAFYGLHSKPFQLNPDPRFYFASKQHRRAKAYLDYGILRNEGFIVVTGEVGTGKTTIVRGLLDSLDATEVVAARLVSTQLGSEDILRIVGAAFGVKTTDITKADLLIALEVFLVSQAGQGKRCLLVVDEAQNLSPRAIEELRMLSNFQFGTQALLQTFLVGQPEFRRTLQHPDMKQLRQRVIAACHIGPLDAVETQGYIDHRLEVAGANGLPRIDAGAYEAVFRVSGGIPRRINSICDRLLLLGFLANRSSLTDQDVSEVDKELREECGAEPSLHNFQGNSLLEHGFDKNLDRKDDALFASSFRNKCGSASTEAEEFHTRLDVIERRVDRLTDLASKMLSNYNREDAPYVAGEQRSDDKA